MTLVMAPSMTGFPLIAAVRGMINSCRKCGHGNVNIPGALRMAINRYKNNPEFLAECKKLFKLPEMLGGVLVK